MTSLFIAIGCLAACAAAPSSPATTAASLRAAVAAAAPASLARHGVPAVGVAYIADGRVQWSVVYGEQSPGVPATPETLFNIASMTKPITAEVVLRLASGQQLSLDDRMSDVWIDPDIADDPRHGMLTPRIALQHRTGFPNWRSATGGRLAFRFDPGTATGYSGEGYDYVARFVEQKTGRDFVTQLRQVVSGPSDMGEVTFLPPTAMQGRVAHPQGPAGEWRAPDFSTPWSAADNLYATVDGYARFMAAVMANAGVSPPIAASRYAIADNLIATGCPLPPQHCPTSVGFGLGWEVLDYGSERVVRHTGSDWGERTIGFFVPSRNVGVVIFTNGANGNKVIRDLSALLVDLPAFNALLDLQAQ